MPEKGAISHRPCSRKKVEISVAIRASEATTVILNRHVAELFGFNMMMPLPVSGLNSEYTMDK